MICPVKMTECQHACTRYRSPTGLWEGPDANGFCSHHNQYFSAIKMCVVRQQLRGQAHIGDFIEVQA